MSKFIIPEHINVGYQERKDTYTDRLAFVTYKDTLGNIKSENSWNGWRDNNIEPTENQNTPTTGFVLNKNGGGSWGHFDRAEFVRVYDPRGFEIEISIDNLLKIISFNGISKGNGIEGELVYAWEQGKKKLTLLPTISPEYTEYLKTKVDQSSKQLFVKKSETPGTRYLFKNNKVLTYLGKYQVNVFDYYGNQTKQNYHIFTNDKQQYLYQKNFNNVTHSLDVDNNYVTLLDSFASTWHMDDICTEILYKSENISNIETRGNFYKYNDDIYKYYTNYQYFYQLDKSNNQFKYNRDIKSLDNVIIYGEKVYPYLQFNNELIPLQNEDISGLLNQNIKDLKNI